MANLIKLKQIESGSALNTAAGVGNDFSASVYQIIDGAGLVSSSAQIIFQDTVGQISSSKITGDIVANSVNYENIINLPTLVSGSTQILGILDSLNSFTASLDNTFATDVELAVTTSNLNIDMGEF